VRRWRWLIALALVGAACALLGPKVVRQLQKRDKPVLEERPPLQPYVSQEAYAQQDARRLALRLQELQAGDRPASDGPAVVMVVLDTFRADRLLAYGADEDIAPHLNAFAREATVFTKMRSTGTWTLPSHASLFTGLYPIEHGARGSPAESASRAYALPDGPPTLAERLSEAGWVTVGLAANRAFLDSAWGLSRGFDVWMCEDLPARDGLSYPQADRITALAAATLQLYALEEREEPLFLFLNYMDAHTPWIPREGYTANPERVDPLLLPKGGTWESRGRWRVSRNAVLSQRREPSPEELATWAEAYDAEVRFLDEWFGELLTALAAAGVGEDDYVVVVSDHGEFLGEHDLLEHSKDVYEPVLRVPLMIRGPGFAPGEDPRAAQTHDVPNLLLEALGLTPLSEEDGDPSLQISELYWARHRDLKVPDIADRFDRVRRAFVRGAQKLVLTEGEGADAYDLASDPDELRSVAGAVGGLGADDWVAPMTAEAERWLSERAAAEGADVSLSDEQRDRLRALGYIQ